MNFIESLRELVDYQQFDQLGVAASQYYDETLDVDAYPLMAMAAAQLGDRQAAMAALNRAVKAQPQLSFAGRVDLAGAHCFLFHLDAARELLEALLKEQPDQPLAQARLAWVLLQFGELERAEQLYQSSAALADHRLPVWLALARLALQKEDSAGAELALHRAQVKLADSKQRISAQVGEFFVAQLEQLQLEIWIAQEQFSEAELWLDDEQVVREEEQWAAVVAVYANALAANNHHSQAEEALKSALKAYPNNIAFHAQLAELAQLQGRQMQVVQLLRRAIKLCEEQQLPTIQLWVRLANAQMHGNAEQARKAADKAVELAAALEPSDELSELQIKQQRMQAKNSLAQVESQEQHYDLAETLFNELLEENPYFLPALSGLGQQQMQRGRIDSAIELFERVKAIDPAKGYSALINARQFPEDDATLERLEQVANQPSLEGSERASLQFQLASVWEKRKDYDKAIGLANSANSASRKFLSYDPVAHRQRSARIRYAFGPELYQHRADCGLREGDDARVPVYVVGMPRSGTTLVEQILAGHSEIFGAGELGVIPQRIQGLERWERHVGSGRHYPDCVDDLSPYVSRGIAEGIVTELRELAETDKPGARFVVDKLPHNFENVGFIKFLFPHAKIISVRRDPRDIALSNYFTDYQAKHGGMGFAYDLEWIGQQLADHNLYMHEWQQRFPGEILEINYEDVVADTEAMARKMLDYIGVDWQPQVLAFNELERPVKTASVWQVRQPIYKTSTEKWRRYQGHLAPLIAGANAKIEWQPIEMVSLPEAGLLNEGVAHYRERRLDDAERCFKKLLHHLPDYAAANFMTGLVYADKGHLADGCELLEKALAACPWNRKWRKDLIVMCEAAGLTERAQELKQEQRRGRRHGGVVGDNAELEPRDDFADDADLPFTHTKSDVAQPTV